MLDKGPIKLINHISVSELLGVLSEYIYPYIFLLEMYQKDLIHPDSIIHP